MLERISCLCYGFNRCGRFETTLTSSLTLQVVMKRASDASIQQCSPALKALAITYLWGLTALYALLCAAYSWGTLLADVTCYNSSIDIGL